MTSTDSSQQQRAAAKRTAAWMGLTALLVYGLFIYLTARGGQ